MNAVANGRSSSASGPQPHESLIFHMYHEAREAWHRTPFLHRILSFTIVSFSLLFVCYVLLLVDASEDYRAQQRFERYPELLRRLDRLVSAVSVEGEITAAFADSHSNATVFDMMDAAREDTDAATDEILAFWAANSAVVSPSPNYPLPSGTTRLTESGVGSIAFLRSQVEDAQILLPVQEVRKYFYDVNQRILRQMMEFSIALNERSAMTPMLLAAVATAFGYQSTTAMQALQTFSSPNATLAQVNLALKTIATSSVYMQSLSSYGLDPLLSESDVRFFKVANHAATFGNSFSSLAVDATSGALYDTSVHFRANVSFGQARSALATQAAKSLVDPNSVSVKFYARSFVMTLVAAVAVIAAATQWVVVESLNAEKNAIRIRNAHVMHDVLVRVGELVDCMASFSLETLPPPRSMMGTRVGILELRLQHCLASLKTLAPTLPPLLFPKRLKVLAAEYSEVKDPATMQFNRKLRDSLLKEPLQQVTEADILRNPHADTLRALTKLQVSSTEAAFLFVDLTAFHDLTSNEKLQFASETFRDVAAAIEECIYQFSGVLHGISLDRAVGVWNIDTKISNYCEQAATCGLVLSNRLLSLRRHNKLLKEHFSVHVGVVAGPVRVGIFGDATAKYLQLFGEPLEKGIKVARANSYHMTTVACDETVRKAVEKIYLAKPIELIDDGTTTQCIYEVIHEGSRREADLETQLMVYSKAFELFEKKYYREALRAFRAYTKLYGYDSSVERIQALISGM